MEKNDNKPARLGTALILIENTESVPELNNILSNHAGIIIARQGIHLTEKPVRMISLVVEGNTDEIGSLTGKIGKLQGVSVKSVLCKA